jgi:hypothetical protein
MATKAGSALWLALAGGHHRETAVISKAEVSGGQSSLVLSKDQREAERLLERCDSSCVALR